MVLGANEVGRGYISSTWQNTPADNIFFYQIWYARPLVDIISCDSYWDKLFKVSIF